VVSEWEFGWSNIAFTTKKYYQAVGYWIFKNHKNSKFCLSHSLTTVARLETKRSSTQSPFYNTRINLLMRCAFWGSDKSAPSHYFHLPLGRSSSSSETISTYQILQSTLSLSSILYLDARVHNNKIERVSNSPYSPYKHTSKVVSKLQDFLVSSNLMKGLLIGVNGVT